MWKQKEQKINTGCRTECLVANHRLMTHFRLIHYNSPPRKSIPGMLNFTVAVKQVILSPLAAKTSASTL